MNGLCSQPINFSPHKIIIEKKNVWKLENNEDNTKAYMQHSMQNAEYYCNQQIIINDLHD